MKITYNKINQILPVYGKLMSIEFEGEFEEATKLGSQFILIEDSMKTFEKVKAGIIKKYNLESPDPKIMDDERRKIEAGANKDFEALLKVEVDMNLSPIKKEYISKIKLRPLEALLINDLGLISKE